MFTFKRSPLNKLAKQPSADPGYPTSSNSNPFNSDPESDGKKNAINSSRRTSSEPALLDQGFKANPFDDDDDHEGRETSSSSSSSYKVTYAMRKKYNNGFRDEGGLENQTVEELEDYAVYKSKETTTSVNNLVKIAGDIREDATKTLVTLHHQGEQITRTHTNAADIEHDLSRGEKLLGSLGGMFSKTWKPKKTHSITGPKLMRDDPLRSKGHHLEQKQRLGLLATSNERPRTQQPSFEPANKLQTVEVEKMKQDDALNDLSNILGELKVMAIDMGSEIERQSKTLDHFDADVEELNFRVKGANRRTARLLGK